MTSKSAASSILPVPARQDSTLRIFITVAIGLGLIIIPLIVLNPLISAGFVSWDDYATIAHNSRLNPPTWDGLAWYWSHQYMGLYMPMTYVAWGVLSLLARTPELNFQGAGLDPSWFHTANLLLHCACTLLVWLLLRRLVKSQWAAAAGAIIFALHPLQVETVGWVSGLKDLFCVFFSLLALLLYTIFAERSADPGDVALHRVNRWRKNWGLYAAALVCLVLAMLSKPLAMVTPALALAIDGLVVGRKWWRAIIDLLPWIALSGACMIVAHISQPTADVVPPLALGLRPLVAGDTLAFYLHKLVWPVHLSIDYGRTPQAIFAAGVAYYTWIVPAAVALAALLLWRKIRLLGLGLLLFLLAIAPLLGLMPFGFQEYSSVADHYMYLPMLGIALAIAGVLDFVAAATSPKVDRRGRSGARTHRARWVVICTSGVVAAIAIMLGIMSNRQTAAWQSSDSLYSQALHASEADPATPGSNAERGFAYNGLAMDEYEQEQWYQHLWDQALHSRAPQSQVIADAREAQRHLMLGVELAKKATQYWHSKRTFSSLGILQTAARKPSEALAAYKKALEYGPRDTGILTTYGVLLAETGHTQEATETFEKSISIDPDDAAAHLNFGALLANEGKWQEAKHEMEIAHRLEPQNEDIADHLKLVQQHFTSR